MRYINRLQERQLREKVKQFQVVCLTGPRQSGKSTLLKHTMRAWEYITFDERGMVERAIGDPDLFIKNLGNPVVIDEAQKAPEVFHSIKALVDEDPKKRFILSGSANFNLMQGVTETLAGRVSLLELLPFSIGELQGHDNPTFFADMLKTTSFSELLSLVHGLRIKSLDNLYFHILWGGFPKVYEFKSREERIAWLEGYRTTYIERDLRNLAQVGNLGDFQKFYQALAFQTGNILNLSDLSKDIGISVPTCKRYLDILRTSYQASTLPAYYANVRKRLVKTPKCYLSDTGLVSFFLRYESEEMLKNSGRLGAIFETWVVNEVRKLCTTLTVAPNIYFWKPHSGFEVDLVLECGEYLYPIEIKHASRIQNSDFRGLVDFSGEVKDRKIPFGIVLYRGGHVQTVAPNIVALPLEYLWQ